MNKKESICIKGIAVIFMVASHLFAQLAWYREEFFVNGFPFQSMLDGSFIVDLASAGGICIGLFAFVSGYGLYYKYNSRTVSIKSRLDSIVRLLIPYWITLLIVIGINNLCADGYSCSFTEIIANMFLLKFNLLPFAWYIRFYVLIVISYPFLLKSVKSIIRQGYGIILLLLVSVISVIATKIIGWNSNHVVIETARDYFLYLPHILFGSICAANNWFGELERRYERYCQKNIKFKSILLSTVSCVIVILVRAYVTKGNTKADPLLCLFFIGMFHIFYKYCNMWMMKGMLYYCGKYSVGIWFIHSIFFFPSKTFQGIVVIPREVCLIFIWVMVICLAYAIILDCFSNFIYKFYLNSL